MDTAYQKVYYVGLLDDIHNYFPALLYDTRKFNSVADILGYIRETTVRRFNLYDNANQNYHANISSIPQTTNIPHVPQVPTNIFIGSEQPRRRTSDLSSILRQIIPRNTQPFQDVIIASSQELINSSSTEETLTQDLDGTCTICQDRMRQGELVRKLTICSHQFHKACIDNWLLNQSVHCPICRHDIRESNTTPAASTNTRTSNLRQRSELTSEMSPQDLLVYLFARDTLFR